LEELRYSPTLSNHLVRRGYDVTLLGYSKSHQDLDAGSLRREYALATSPSLGRFIDRLALPLHVSNLIRNLSSKDCSIVLSIMLHSSLLGYMLARRLRPKCHIVSFSGGDAAISSMTGIWLENMRMDYYLYSKLAITLNNPTSVFIATTKLMKRQMIKAGVKRGRIVVIPRFVEERFFRVDPTESVLEGNDIVYVGRFSEEKGIKILLKAFEIVARKLPDAKLRLIGEGPLLGFILRYVRDKGIQEKVEITGKVPYEAVHTYLTNSTLFVLPSLNEGLPNALIQAMAAGLPIVASKVGSIPEAVRNGIDGLLVKPGSPNELAESIARILKDRELALKLARNAKSSAERYRADYIIEKYTRLFEACSEVSNK